MDNTKQDNTNQQSSPSQQQTEQPQTSPSSSAPSKTFKILVGVLLLTLVIIIIFTLRIKQNQPVVQNNQITTPTTTSQPSPTINPTANWKTYDNSKYKIYYPPEWTAIPLSDPNPPFELVLRSPDYKEPEGPGYFGGPQSGFSIILDYAWDRWPLTMQGVVSSTETKWLGENATLRVVKWESNTLVLSTKHNEVDIHIAMTAASDQVRENNKDIFLKVANTLIIK